MQLTYKTTLIRASMKLPLLLFSVSLLIVASCKNAGTGDRLPPALMKKVLTDVQMAETYSTMVKDSLHKNTGMKNLDSLSVYYKDIFAHYKITEAQFTTSLNWYKEHPDEMDSLYNEMLATVAAMQNTLQKPLPVPQNSVVPAQGIPLMRK
jgi:acyl-CoA synthetase (AMP-forming)/AMP-acid ligase II